MYFCPGLRARAAPRVQGVVGQVQGHVRQGLRGDPRDDPRRPEAARAASRRHRAVADQPARRARRDGSRRPAVAAARLRAPLGLAVRRREAPVRADGRGVRGVRLATPTTRSARLLDYLDESGQLDNTIIIVVSDNGASGEGGPNGSFNENKFFNGVPDTHRGEPRSTSTSSAAPSSYNHYNTGWAWAFDTPFPYWKRFAGYEGGIADPLHGRLAERDHGAGERAPPVHPRGRRRPDDVRPARHRAARGPQGLHAEPDRGRELRAARFSDPAAPGEETQFYSMLGHARDLPRGLAREHACTRRSPAGASSSSTSGSSTTSTEDRAQFAELAAEHPEKLRS